MEPLAEISIDSKAAIADLCFIPGADQIIAVAYETGRVVLYNYESDEVVGELNTPSSSSSSDEPVLFCVASNGTWIAAGAREGEVYIWDIQTGKPFMVFDMHTDDVTSLQFHPGNPEILFTASEDGLINQHNITTDDPEETLETAFNIEQPISRFGFFGPEGEFLYVLSNVETLSLWTIEDGERISDFSNARADLSKAIDAPVDYLVDCVFEPSSNRLFLVGGQNNGVMVLFHVNADELQPVRGLANGHRGKVRDFSAIWSDGFFLSAGEDSRLSAWSCNLEKYKGSEKQ